MLLQARPACGNCVVPPDDVAFYTLSAALRAAVKASLRAGAAEGAAAGAMA